MEMTPDFFFIKFVEGNFEDFKNEQNCIRKGFNTAVAMFHMADHYFNYFSKHDKNKINQIDEREDFLKYLSKKCEYFNDVQSIANAYKHLYQRNPDKPHVTIASAGVIENFKYDGLEITGDMDDYVGYVRLGSCEKRRLYVALENVIEMWREIV